MIPRTVFGAEHDQLRASFRRFLEQEVVPYHARWERDGLVDREIWRKAGAHGFLVPTAPEQFGGAAGDFLHCVVMDEETNRLGLSGLGFAVHSTLAAPYILRLGTDTQKEAYLPSLISGDRVLAVAMTEPMAGSDLQGLKTRATRDGDDFVINGSKTFITNGQHADLVIVVCRTDPDAGAHGFSLILVEDGTPGFRKGSNLDKLGLKAQDTSELFFDDVRVPASNLLGEINQGFVHLMEELPQERLTIAVGSVAAAESVLEQTVAYVEERSAFGKPISAYQNTQFKLAQMAAEVTCVRAFVDRCLELHSQGGLDQVTASKAKLLATELQGRVADECVQLHGGYGYMWEYGVTRAYADARITRILGGSNEVMRLIIARSLFSETQ